MKRTILFLFIVHLVTLAYSEEKIISVSDFSVASENPQYKHIGKGLSRLLAGELKNASEIRLVERERLNVILEEQEFGLSDLADQSKQVQVGKLLSANYIVIGEVIDMISSLVTSVRLIDVETSEVIFEDELTEQLERYDYICASFATEILKALHISAAKETLAKIDRIQRKQKEAIISLSEGIDAIDRGKTDEARAQLKKAKRFDPTNKVVREYLSKLITNSTKFKAITENYFAYQNPAFLGIMKTDRFNVTVNVPYNFPANIWQQLPDREDLYVMELDGPINIGYWFPAGRSSGYGIEIFSSGRNYWFTQQPESGEHYENNRSNLGAIISVGTCIANTLAIGFSASIYGVTDAAEPPFMIGNYLEEGSGSSVGLSLGILAKNRSSTVIFDTRIGWSSGNYYMIDDYQTFDFATLTEPRIPPELLYEHVLPLFLENTLTFSLNNNNTFVVLKQLNDIYLDRTFYFGDILPVIEHYPAKWLSLRTGVEISYTITDTSRDFGYGVLGGLTFRIISWKFDIDLNATYRMRPSRAIQGLMYRELLILVNLNWNDRFMSRRQQ